MQIEEWLRSLGLQQYAAAFRDNAIDAEVLPELTETDLEKLGVLLGDRKRLLKAIEACGTDPPSQPQVLMRGPRKLRSLSRRPEASAGN